MNSATTAKEGRREFPPTFRLDDGDRVVALALEQRTATTQYGERIVVEVVLRGEPEDKTFTLWWPRKLATPPLHTPFALHRKTKSEYTLHVSEGADEASKLWKSGEIPGAAGGNTDSPKSKVRAILDKLDPKVS